MVIINTLLIVTCPVLVLCSYAFGNIGHSTHLNRLSLLAHGQNAKATVVGRRIESGRKGQHLYEALVTFSTAEGLITGSRGVPAREYDKLRGDRPLLVTYVSSTPDRFVLGDAKVEFADEPKRLDPEVVWFSIAALSIAATITGIIVIRLVK